MLSAILRAVVSAPVVAIVGQPVFAGVYLSGDFDGLRWHSLGADVVTYLSYLQLIVTIVVWVRLRVKWPFGTTVVGVVVLFIGVWSRPPEVSHA